MYFGPMKTFVTGLSWVVGKTESVVKRSVVNLCFSGLRKPEQSQLNNLTSDKTLNNKSFILRNGKVKTFVFVFVKYLLKENGIFYSYCMSAQLRI